MHARDLSGSNAGRTPVAPAGREGGLVPPEGLASAHPRIDLGGIVPLGTNLDTREVSGAGPEVQPLVGGTKPISLPLTPMQQRVTDDLLTFDVERPIAEPWAEELYASIDDALGEHSGRIKKDRLFFGKAAISDVLACESRHVARRHDFHWTPRTARGEIIHRAIALVAAGHQPDVHELAAAALDHASCGSSSLSLWLRDQPASARVAVLAEALPGIATVLASMPPLKPCWRMVPEYPVAAELLGGRIRVAGRVDLVLGRNQAELEGGIRRKQVFIELKSGRQSQDHRAEHLMYALLATLSTGIAPWRVATYWLDEGGWLIDTITKELLVVAAGRLTGALKHLIELDDGREPTRRAGWRCAYCPLSQRCSERIEADALRGEIGGVHPLVEKSTGVGSFKSNQLTKETYTRDCTSITHRGHPRRD